MQCPYENRLLFLLPPEVVMHLRLKICTNLSVLDEDKRGLKILLTCI